MFDCLAADYVFQLVVDELCHRHLVPIVYQHHFTVELVLAEHAVHSSQVVCAGFILG